jgi:hypothetical protein
MNEEELKAQVAELTAQLAAMQASNDDLESRVKDANVRADKAEGELASTRHTIDELKAERADTADTAELKSKLAAMTALANKERKARQDAESPERLRQAVQKRVELEGKAVAVLGDEARFDDMLDRAVMVQVIEKLQGAIITDAHSDDYVRARFDAATEGHARGTEALARQREATALKKPTERTDAASARAAMIQRNQSAWQGDNTNQV